ncbi:uracil-DNA glycosylase family protein [uncultured Kriegella sp.]|uniref:uracil-DNA glycosylase family protein n=1 Tax=uncultured Kriegella sp. TaxID=1798910 RepID=UPI0030DD75F4|tara:strand:- start:18999 stop:19685 length:687 start_codon:yes stop_codon:yes gene_type:complete
MFLHTHPYAPFLFESATKLIVGTLPPPRFTTGDFKKGDVDFCYGSRDGQLWPILDKIFDLNLKFENSDLAVTQRKAFLKQRKIGICDIVASAQREKIDASDLGMRNIELRNILGFLHDYPNIDTLLFTGGNSKNGPEYFFRKHLKEWGVKLKVISDRVPRIHEFILPPREDMVLKNSASRMVRTVSLTAPSGAANRAVGSLDEYKQMKIQNPKFNTLDFRVLQYQDFF